MKRACTVCGLPASFPIHGRDGAIYCCNACAEVARLIDDDYHIPDSAPAASSQKATLPITGLYCPSCAWLIEARLRRAPGVQSASVNFIRREARLLYDDSKTNPKKLAHKIRSLGYKAGLPGEEPADEEEAFFTRFLIGLMLAMHIMVTSLIIYVRTWLGMSAPETLWLEEIFYLMQFVVVIPLLFVLGLPVLRAGLASLLRGLPNTHTLVTLGVSAAVGLSAYNLFSGSGPVYFDTAAMLLLLMSLGHWLEMRTQKSSREAAKDLNANISDSVTFIGPDGDQHIPLDTVRPGMRLRSLPGEGIPVDGLIATGTADIDESALTGEPIPEFHREGDRVWAGTLNLDGDIEIITQQVGQATRAGQINRLLHQALWQRSPAERLADRLAAWLIPAALIAASATFWFWFRLEGLESAMLNALSVLLIACPCALGLATPLTLWQALTRAVQNGVVLQNTTVFEKLSSIRHIYFDKTGTLTRLPMRVQAIYYTNNISEADLIRLAAAVESRSEHPIAGAILAFAESRNLEWIEPEHFKVFPGRGVSGTIDGQQVRVGGLQFFKQSKVSTLPAFAGAQAKKEHGLTPILVECENRISGIFWLGESPRQEAVDTIEDLARLGYSVELLSGDPLAAEKDWLQRLGISIVAGLAPEDKLAHIQGNPHAVMVGDGINDGPALAAASVGICLASGSDVARAAADVILVRDDLRALPWLFEFSAHTNRRVRQNLVWAIFYNLIGISLAATGLLLPVLAALAMVVSSLLVTQNAMRLHRYPGIQTKGGEKEEKARIEDLSLSKQTVHNSITP